MEVSAAHKKGIRIMVVGDPRTGKSSLIHTAVSGTFPTKVARVLPPTLLPDFPPDRVPVTVIDTSVEQKNKLEEELRRADAIVLTYLADWLGSRNRLFSYWIPKIRQLELERVPLIVVGCKVDLRIGGKLQKLEHLKPIMQLYPEIDTCMECSAYKGKQVQKVFYHAKKAVLYPTAPLIDYESWTLRPKVVDALRQIFFLCDHDKDGFLSDAELNDFQIKCFNTPLQPSQIVFFKKVVQTEGINERGLTFSGFIFIHADSIEKGQPEIVWTVLRKFGFNNDIRLDNLLPLSCRQALHQIFSRLDHDSKDRPQMSPRVRVSTTPTPAVPVESTHRRASGGNEDRPQMRSKARVSKAMPVEHRHDRDTKDRRQMRSRVRVSKATPVDRHKDRPLIPSSGLLDVNPRHGILAYLDNFRDGYAFSCGYQDHETGGGSCTSTSSDLDFILPDWDVFIADGSSSNAGSSQSNDEIHFLAKYVNTEEEGPDLDIYICKLEKGTNFAKQAARHLDVLQRTNGNSRLTTLTSYNLGNAARIEDGGRLVEVFSVRISNNSNSRNYCRDIYGTIRVEHNGEFSDGSYIFHRLRDDDKCISLYDDTLYLVGPPHVIYFPGFFEVTLDLKYKGDDLFPPDYENRCFALNGFFLPKDFEHGKLMCKEFHGYSGSATMYYTVFDNAVEANVKVELFGGDRVYGSIIARYSHYDYSTDDEMKYYQSVLFHKKSSDYVKLKLQKVIPIPRAVAVPTKSSLVIEANLWNYNERKQDDRIAKGFAEFPPRAHGGTSVIDIKGDKGFARVTVAWKCAESFFLCVPPISF